MYAETLEIVKSHMSHTNPITPTDLGERAGISRASVYNALNLLKAERHHIGKNLFGYTLPVEKPNEIDTPGFIEGLTWAQYTGYALDYVRQIHLHGNTTAEAFAVGFQQVADSFATIASHAKAVQHRPDWRLVLGLDQEQ